jgi:dolichol-phosphate mannosyltransferase
VGTRPISALEIRRESIRNPLAISPTYNEAASLPTLLKTLFAADSSLHVLIIDDASPDGTAKVVRDHPEFSKRLHLLERGGKLGLGSAYREGFRWAAEHAYDACVEIDADLSHDPADVPRLLKQLNDETADAIIGSRYLDGLRVVNWPEHRLLISAFATQFVRFVLGMPLTDATSGFKALRVAALQKMDWSLIRAEGYGFQVELHHALWRSGARLKEIPIVFTERREGHTKMNVGIALEAAMRVLALAVPKKPSN